MGNLSKRSPVVLICRCWNRVWALGGGGVLWNCGPPHYMLCGLRACHIRPDCAMSSSPNVALAALQLSAAFPEHWVSHQHGLAARLVAHCCCGRGLFPKAQYSLNIFSTGIGIFLSLILLLLNLGQSVGQCFCFVPWSLAYVITSFTGKFMWIN